MLVAGAGGAAQLAVLTPVLFLTLSAKGVAKPGTRHPQASKLLPGLEPRDASYPILAKAIKVGRAVGLPGAGGEVLHGGLVVHGGCARPAAAPALPGLPTRRLGTGRTDVRRRPMDGLPMAATAPSYLLRQQAGQWWPPAPAQPCRMVSWAVRAVPAPQPALVKL